MTKYVNFFANTFLFKSIVSQDIGFLLENVEVEEYSYTKGAQIYSPEKFDRKLGFVFRGECLIGRYSGGSIIPLNTIKEFDSFGVSTVFSDRDEFPTVIVAKSDCTVLFIHTNDLHKLITLNPKVSINVINFLTRKINFLNDKIAAFSGGSIEEKLANYILSLKRKHNSLKFDFNKKKSAEALNCGRASLYRAIDALKSAGYVTFEDKKIILLDLTGLERISK